MSKGKRYGRVVLIFMGGFVCALNISTMYPNETYAASWLNVCIACGLSIAFGIAESKGRSK